jgi:NTE family protein
MIFSHTIIFSVIRFGARVISVLLAALMTVPVSTGAQQPASRPKVALVFEGGGALGFAHIGVIDWIEAHHIPVDYVAGTSMGGLVGGLYASGMSAERA